MLLGCSLRTQCGSLRRLWVSGLMPLRRRERPRLLLEHRRDGSNRNGRSALVDIVTNARLSRTLQPSWTKAKGECQLAWTRACALPPRGRLPSSAGLLTRGCSCPWSATRGIIGNRGRLRRSGCPCSLVSRAAAPTMRLLGPLWDPGHEWLTFSCPLHMRRRQRSFGRRGRRARVREVLLLAAALLRLLMSDGVDCWW